MPNGTSIKINTARMAMVAKTIENQRSIIENALASILQDACALKDCWEGESADAYYLVMKNLLDKSVDSSATTRIVGSLREYEIDLNQIAEQFAGTERDLKVKNESLPSDVFGV